MGTGAHSLASQRRAPGCSSSCCTLTPRKVKVCLSDDLTLGGKERDWSGEPLDEDVQGWVTEQGGKTSPQLPVRGSALLGTALGQEMCIWGHARQWMAGPVWPLLSLPVIMDDIGSVLTAPHQCGRAIYSPHPPPDRTPAATPPRPSARRDPKPRVEAFPVLKHPDGMKGSLFTQRTGVVLGFRFL